MRFRVVKMADVDDDVVQQALEEYTDWIEERGILAAGSDRIQYDYNSDLVKKFIEHRNSIVH